MSTESSPSRMRLTPLLLGGILWLAVFAAVAATFFIPSRTTTSPPAGVVSSGSSGSIGSAVDEDAEDADPVPGKITLNVGDPYGSIWSSDGIADFTFQNQNGETVTKQDLLGHDWIVCFFFTRCVMSCQQISQQIEKLQQTVDNPDIRFVSITVDPDRDTPEKLKSYGETFDADFDRWWFLTGPKAEVYDLVQRSFRMPVSPVLDDKQAIIDIVHSNNILHVGPDGVVRDKYNALDDAAMAKLRRTLREIGGEGPLPEDTTAAEAAAAEATAPPETVPE